MAIKLVNHTAISFPLEYPQGVPEPSPPGFPSGLAGGQEAWLLFWYGEPQLHRFRLEIKRTGVDRSGRLERVSIVANGQRHKMKQLEPIDPNNLDITGGSENWVWDSPDHLLAEYRYAFTVETEPIVTPSPTRVPRCPEQGFFRANVSLDGLVSWFVRYGHPTNSPNGQLYMYQGNRYDVVFFVQNLSPIDAIWNLTLSGTNQGLFSVTPLSSRPGPQPLKRGDIVGFLISFDFQSAPSDTVLKAYLNLVVSARNISRALLKTRFVLCGDSNDIGG
jgi:hypothetical protein